MPAFIQWKVCSCCMNVYYQSMLDRARQRRELLAARMAMEESNSTRKRPVDVNNENGIRNGVSVDDGRIISVQVSLN